MNFKSFFSRETLGRVKFYVLAHKIISGTAIVLLVLLSYWIYTSFIKSDSETKYVLAAAEKGNLIVSVSGSGQVSVSNQVDIKSKASGDVVYVGVKSGQEVRSGVLIVQIDTRDAQKAVRDAEISLEQAKLDLEKMKGLTTNEGSIRGVKEKAEESIERAYEDGFNTVANAFLEFPAVMSNFQDILYSGSPSLGGNSVWNIDYYASAAAKYDENTVNSDKASQYKADAINKYTIARKSYDQNFNNYKNASRFSDKSVIEDLINETYETTKNIAEAIKSTNNLIQYYKDKLTTRNLTAPAITDTHLSNLNSYTSKTNSYLLSLLSLRTTILTSKEALVETDFDIADQQIKVNQAENTLIEAKEKLSDCYIRAPFDGIVAKLSVKKGDSANSGTSIATFITNQKIAEITLNEVDAAKVKVGQKVTLTFDAIDGLSIAGQVAEVDTIGTVSQGVVNYGIKINFDTQDERVKSGMSVTASIITEMKQDVLMAPNGAIKSQNNAYYVEMFDRQSSLTQGQGITSAVAPRKQSVEVGISNDTMTEVVSGLKEGDQVVSQTSSASASSLGTSNNRSGGFGMPRF